MREFVKEVGVLSRWLGRDVAAELGGVVPLWNAFRFRDAAVFAGDLSECAGRIYLVRGESDLRRQQRRRRTVGVHQLTQVLLRAAHQLGDDPQTLGQRCAVGHISHQEAHVRHAGPVDEVGLLLDGDVVAEPAGVLM